MTLREFLINNNLGFQRQDCDEVIINCNLDYDLVAYTTNRVNANTIVKIVNASTIENTKSICIKVDNL